MSGSIFDPPPPAQKKAAPVDDETNWLPVEGNQYVQRHRITGALRTHKYPETAPKAPPPPAAQPVWPFPTSKKP